MDSLFVTWCFKKDIMNWFLLLAISTLALSNSECNKKNDRTYKGRLEIKAICSNYTIGLLEGDLDSSMYVSKWTDENTGKTYSNVFKLDQPCNFPDSIDAGEEFYFQVDSVKKDCIVCMAYYPVPPKAIAIKVVNK